MRIVASTKKSRNGNGGAAAPSPRPPRGPVPVSISPLRRASLSLLLFAVFARCCSAGGVAVARSTTGASSTSRAMGASASVASSTGSTGSGGVLIDVDNAPLDDPALLRRVLLPQGTGDDRLPTTQASIERYDYLDSEAIHTKVTQLASMYPDFCTLTTSQEKYDLPAAGTFKDCVFDHVDEKYPEGCKNYILTIEDKIAHPPDSSTSSKNLPEVFLSGSLHGNERVGPTTVVETASLLLEVAGCESLPRSNDPSIVEMQAASACREKLEARGVTTRVRKWLARLVSTRRIIVLPTANALGYFQNRREENHIDPNRDFPYDLEDFSQCMQTVAGRTINEIFRNHIIQSSFTFHAGMQAIGYEWGAPTYKRKSSPDDAAQYQLAHGYSWYGGGIDVKSPAYPADDMNDLVYPVRGGMEDWAYGGSWDSGLVKPCTPSTFGGYPPEKTTYEPQTLRMFNMLVETSDDKSPKAKDLGTNEDLFSPNGNGNGHVSRNIRLSLMLIDAVEPYASILRVNGFSLHDDVIPGIARDGDSCKGTKTMVVPEHLQYVNVDWTVGGSFTVDSTRLMYGKWDDISPILSCDAQSQPDPAKLANFYEYANIGISYTDDQSGRTRWHADGAASSAADAPSNPHGGRDMPPDPRFTSRIELGKFKTGDVVAVFASTKVDSTWGETKKGAAPAGLPPQSHVANVRTNTSWHHETADGTHVVQGHVEWFSVPLTLIIGERGVDMEEVSIRVGTREGVAELESAAVRNGRFVAWLYTVARPAMTVVILVLFLVWILACKKRHDTQRDRIFHRAMKDGDGGGGMGDAEMVETVPLGSKSDDGDDDDEEEGHFHGGGTNGNTLSSAAAPYRDEHVDFNEFERENEHTC